MFAVIDIETSGLKTGYHEVLKSHCIITNGEKIIKEQTNEYRPKRILPCYVDAYDIHKISIKEARGFSSKIDSLVSLLEFVPDNSVMVCHSRKSDHYFDYGFMFMEYELANLRFEFYKKFKWCLSTHTLAKKYTKIKKLSLANLCKEYDINLNHHDAKSDTHACFELFKTFYRNHRNEIARSIEYS